MCHLGVLGVPFVSYVTTVRAKKAGAAASVEHAAWSHLAGVTRTWQGWALERELADCLHAPTPLVASPACHHGDYDAFCVFQLF